MKAVSCNDDAVTNLIAKDAAPRFVHIQNNSDTDFRICYDGDATDPTATLGFKLPPGETLMLREGEFSTRQPIRAYQNGGVAKTLDIQGDE